MADSKSMRNMRYAKEASVARLGTPSEMLSALGYAHMNDKWGFILGREGGATTLSRCTCQLRGAGTWERPLGKCYSLDHYLRFEKQRLLMASY